jgi:hypothetical protein
VQAVTIAWMSVEAGVSLLAAWWARSPALIAFGGDSAIELASAVVVIWRFRSNAVSEHFERRAARIAGGLLFALAAFVIATSVMALGGKHPIICAPVADVTEGALAAAWNWNCCSGYSGTMAGKLVSTLNSKITS